ncbi:MAG: hypothetical protein WAL84_12850, partial [Candidatus Dormiibacterota bacterium]
PLRRRPNRHLLAFRDPNRVVTGKASIGALLPNASPVSKPSKASLATQLKFVEVASIATTAGEL